MRAYDMRIVPVFVVALTAVAMAGSPASSGQAAAPPARPIGAPVNVVNVPTSPVPVVPLVPPTQFSLRKHVEGDITQLASGDPPGTRYAITSIVLTNRCCEAVSIRLFAQSGPASPGSDQVCPLRFGEAGEGIERTFGPELIAPRGQSAALTFPQPFVTNALGGGHTCLSMSSSASAFGPQEIIVIGYKL
jgi:hypothetical protein